MMVEIIPCATLNSAVRRDGPAAGPGPVPGPSRPALPAGRALRRGGPAPGFADLGAAESPPRPRFAHQPRASHPRPRGPCGGAGRPAAGLFLFLERKRNRKRALTQNCVLLPEKLNLSWLSGSKTQFCAKIFFWFFSFIKEKNGQVSSYTPPPDGPPPPPGRRARR